MQSHVLACLATAVALAFAAPASQALTTGQTPDGFDFVVGGIGSDELARMATESNGHSLSLRLATRVTGAYLADVVVQITDNAGQHVFKGRLDGPWLLISLPPGRYSITAVYEGEVERAEVVVPVHGHRSVVMRFLADSGLRLAPGEEP